MSRSHRSVASAPLTLTGWALGLLVSASLLVPAPRAVAGDECVSSKLANQLLDCVHCQAMKKLLGDGSIGAVTMEVHDLEHGAVVEIEATRPEAVALVHGLVNELWNTEGHCETELSTVCQNRVHALRDLVVDRALSSHGAIVVLRGADAAQIAWLREDARMTRSIVVSAASR